MSQPIVWTIAGSDSGGGAGVQADLKTFNAFGVYGASVITAITAQNTQAVDKIEAVSPEMIKAQLEALRADLPPTVVKLGMLHSPRCVEIVADILQDLDAFVICDPVMIATSGDALYESSFVEVLKERLLPLVDLLTPNLEEAYALCGMGAPDSLLSVVLELGEAVRLPVCKLTASHEANRIRSSEELRVLPTISVPTAGKMPALPGATRSTKALETTPQAAALHLACNPDNTCEWTTPWERGQPCPLLATELLKLGPKAVLIKGGHDEGELAQDFWTNGHEAAWLSSKRQITRNTHGTGCTMASAIAACLTQGYSQLDAIVIAKAYINQGMRLAPNLGEGNGPLAHLGWPECQDDLPELTVGAVVSVPTGACNAPLQYDGSLWLRGTPQAATLHLERERQFLVRPHLDPKQFGFYPIVDNVQWLERLLPLGVKTIQLRIKDPNLTDLESRSCLADGTSALQRTLESEIIKAIQLAKQYDCRLFINDYWQLAIKHGAYGVHLGQEDLESADLTAIAQANIHLGVSTHSYSEVARTLAIKPSYIAVGPIFATNTKKIMHKPQGIEALKRWRRTLRYPLVAIGGITLQNAQSVLDTGVDGIAVISDITKSPDWQTQTKAWLKLFN